MITGKDLIKAGFSPAKWFGKALKEINASNMSLNEAIAVAQKYKDAQPVHVTMNDNPVLYHLNLDATNDYEESNRTAVQEAMNAIMKLPTALSGSVMPDGCPTGKYTIPVGGVFVADGVVHPAFHSADICCSMFLTEIKGATHTTVLNKLHGVTHFGPGGRPKDERFFIHDDLKDRIHNHPLLKGNELAIQRAFTNMGTQGDGNHFAYVGTRQSSGNVTIVTHHGSRGFGAQVYKIGMRIAENYRKQLAPNIDKKYAWIPMDTEDGKIYWSLLQLVREWTKLNHQLIHDAVVNELGLTVVDRFWNEHNFVFKDGNKYYHAKGATPLLDKFLPDEQGSLRIVPLNMAEPILLVKGEQTENNLGFAPHGAGRNISRSEHKRNMEGLTVQEILERETEGLDVRFFSGKPDISELPSAYKNAAEIQRQMDSYGIADVVDKILPYGCIMAGEIERQW